MERAAGFEPAPAAWSAAVLLLHHARAAWGCEKIAGLYQYDKRGSFGLRMTSQYSPR